MYAPDRIYQNIWIHKTCKTKVCLCVDDLSCINRIVLENNYTHEELGWDWSGINKMKCFNIQDQKPLLKKVF